MAYHPLSNGLVESVRRQLKDALRARGARVDCPACLPWVLLGLRPAPEKISAISSAEAVLGQPLTLPGELNNSKQAPSPPLMFLDKFASPSPPTTCQPHAYAEVVTRPLDWRLQLAKLVYMKRGGPPPAPVYSGLYRIVRLVINIYSSRSEAIRSQSAWTDCKPHLGLSSVFAAAPSRRGHPRRHPPPPSTSSDCSCQLGRGAVRRPAEMGQQHVENAPAYCTL